ncbi:glycosyltransferase [Jeotgalibacillus malaysiensis]|uniref:glycosyltransferase n=1 Tax=Jeotgalibacillus malaysiensis TaxID=1508404 RepID=UPI00384CF1C9
MPKKKLIIMAINMNLGGTEKSLINFISDLSPAKYDITLLLLENKGELLSHVPPYVKIRAIEGYKQIKPYLKSNFKKNSRRLLKVRNMYDLINYFIAYLRKRVSGKDEIMLDFYKSFLEEIDERYDISIAYAGPMDLITYYVAKCINAKRKYQWIHFDIEKIGFSQSIVKNLYPKFDRVFTVSEEGKQKIQKAFPELVNKVGVWKNKTSENSLLHLSNNRGFEDEFTGIRILTVGRLSHEKGQHLIFPVLKRLLENIDLKIKWYLIGDGPEMANYKNTITNLSLNIDVKLLGAKINPYPYMKECDLYVQPSIYEGCCMTIDEAKIFKKRIIATEFNGIKEQLKEYNYPTSIIKFSEKELYFALLEHVNAINNERRGVSVG